MLVCGHYGYLHAWKSRVRANLTCIPIALVLRALEALPRLVCALIMIRCAPKNFMGE